MTILQESRTKSLLILYTFVPVSIYAQATLLLEGDCDLSEMRYHLDLEVATILGG
jgi:hypothetical protein